MGERVLGVDEVGGSNPPASTRSFVLEEKHRKGDSKPSRTHPGDEK